MAAGVATGRYQLEQHGGRHLHAQGGRRAARALPARARSGGSGQETRPGRRERLRRGARQSGAVLRRHHPRVLRAPPARAAGRGRRLAGFHRAGRTRSRAAQRRELARLPRRGERRRGSRALRRARSTPASRRATSTTRSRRSAGTTTSSSRRRRRRAAGPAAGVARRSRRSGRRSGAAPRGDRPRSPPASAAGAPRRCRARLRVADRAPSAGRGCVDLLGRGNRSPASCRSGGPTKPRQARSKPVDRSWPTSASDVVAPVSRRLAPVRLPRSRRRCSRARETPRSERRRAITLNYGDLLHPRGAAAARERRRARGAAGEVPLALRRRVPGHRSRSRPRYPVCSPRADGRASASDWTRVAAPSRAPSSSSATRSSRSTASAAPTSTSTTRCARRIEATAATVVAADDESSGRCRPCATGPTPCSERASRGADDVAPMFAPLDRAPTPGSRSRRRAHGSCPTSVDGGDVAGEPSADGLRATSAARSTPAAARTATSSSSREEERACAPTPRRSRRGRSRSR